MTDIERFADVTAKMMDLPLPADYAQEVGSNLETAFRLAPLFLDFELPDDAEPAAVFRVRDDAP